MYVKPAVMCFAGVTSSNDNEADTPASVAHAAAIRMHLGVMKAFEGSSS